MKIKYISVLAFCLMACSLVTQNKMRHFNKFFFWLLFITITFISCHTSTDIKTNSLSTYTPIDQELHDAIVAMDKEFFNAYNSCDLKKQAAIYSDDIEFFHDKGGLTTSKQDIMDATAKNICGKVTRALVEGSIEVYPINNYGAVQIGYHKFYNNQEPDAPSHPSKFIIMWKQQEQDWTITKVISLH